LNFHCGASYGNFRDLRYFTPPLAARYGTSNSAPDYLLKSSVAGYESHRAMFEGYSRNKYVSTGVIQWMLNNPWPSMIWHLYDYYLNPSAAYFATKLACASVHVQYSYDDNSVYVVNSQYVPISNLKAAADVYDIKGNRLWNNSQSIASIDADTPMRLFTIPAISLPSTTYFVHLRLINSASNSISHNTYWLSTVPDVIRWSGSTWYNTPCSSYADLTQLQTLPKLTLSTTTQRSDAGGITTFTVSVTNPNNAIAFFIRLRATKGNGGDDILPILWDDNYITLFPLENRLVKATFSTSLLGGTSPELVVEVFNNISGGH